MLKKEKKRANDAISELESFGQLPRQSSSASESSMANSRSNSRNQQSPDKSLKMSQSEEKAKQQICKNSVTQLFVIALIFSRKQGKLKLFNFLNYSKLLVCYYFLQVSTVWFNSVENRYTTWILVIDVDAIMNVFVFFLKKKMLFWKSHFNS